MRTRWPSCYGKRLCNVTRVLAAKRWRVEWWLFVWRYFGYRFFGCRRTRGLRCDKWEKFSVSLNSVASDNVTSITSNFGSGFKASRNDMLRAWGLMKLKTDGLDQKFFNATHVADETQMCKTECTVDTFEYCTSSGVIDRQLVCETQKGQKDNASVDRCNFAQLWKELEECVQSQLNENQLICSVAVEPTDEHQGQNAGIGRTGKLDQKSMATVLHSWVHDDQQPRREDFSGFLMDVEHKVERRIASRFPEIARLFLDYQSLSRKERWSRLEASRQQSWQGYRRNGSYSRRRGGEFIKASEEEGFHAQRDIDN